MGHADETTDCVTLYGFRPSIARSHSAYARACQGNMNGATVSYWAVGSTFIRATPLSSPMYF
jgi:hypothetical protein